MQLTPSEIGGIVSAIGLGGLTLIKTGLLKISIGKNNGKNNGKLTTENLQIKAVDKRVDRLSDVVQYASTCDARYNDLKGDTTQIRDDVKDILKEMRK